MHEKAIAPLEGCKIQTLMGCSASLKRARRGWGEKERG